MSETATSIVVPDAKLAYPLFDADNHLYETEDSLTKYLPKQYKGAIQYVQVNGRTKIAIRGHISDYIPNPTFEVVARPGAMEDYFKHGNPEGKSRREIFGEPMRGIPAFREPGPRLELMNELGVDRSLMPRHWPASSRSACATIRLHPRRRPCAGPVAGRGLGFSYQNRITRCLSSASRSSRRPSRGSTGWCRVAPAPSGPPGSGAGLSRARSYALPEFDPFWQRCVDHDVLVPMHTSDSGYARYSAEW
jgi:hypothetical protein